MMSSNLVTKNCQVKTLRSSKQLKSWYNRLRITGRSIGTVKKNCFQIMLLDFFLSSFEFSLTLWPNCPKAVTGLSQGRRRAIAGLPKGHCNFFLVIFFFDIILSYSLLHLAAESHNSSQAEKIITVLPSWANSQNDTQNCPGCYHFE